MVIPGRACSSVSKETSLRFTLMSIGAISSLKSPSCWAGKEKEIFKNVDLKKKIDQFQFI